MRKTYANQMAIIRVAKSTHKIYTYIIQTEYQIPVDSCLENFKPKYNWRSLQLKFFIKKVPPTSRQLQKQKELKAFSLFQMSCQQPPPPIKRF